MARYNRGAHAVYYARHHVIWIPRFRRKILTSGVAPYLRTKIPETSKYYPDIYFVEIGVQKDHIHLLISIPPRYSVSRIVNIIKSNTSRVLREKFQFLEKVYWDGGSIWATGYMVSTVGVSEAAGQKYIPCCLTAERHRSLSYSGGGKLLAEPPLQEGAGQANGL